MKKFILVSLLVFSLSISSCATPEENQPEEVEPAQPASINLDDVPTADPNKDGENIVIPAPRERDSEEKLIHNISLDLSTRLNIDISEVRLIESLPVTWDDGGLGCPAEGVTYEQANVDGYKVTLEVGGSEYIYHSNGLREFVWCDGGVPKEPVRE